jgi:hypothetical protein
MHLPVQAESQQTPSTHWPDLHWSARSQAWPRPRNPQLPLVQSCGTTQSSRVVQVSLHAPSAQIDGEQFSGEPARQTPLPSQVEAGMRPLPEQADGLQTTPAA